MGKARDGFVGKRAQQAAELPEFETLREEGKYERMRERILERDVELAGSINPMLSRHGDASEARQYSGRVIEKGWQCPFRDKRLEEAA